MAGKTRQDQGRTDDGEGWARSQVGQRMGAHDHRPLSQLGQFYASGQRCVSEGARARGRARAQRPGLRLLGRRRPRNRLRGGIGGAGIRTDGRAAGGRGRGAVRIAPRRLRAGRAGRGRGGHGSVPTGRRRSGPGRHRSVRPEGPAAPSHPRPHSGGSQAHQGGAGIPGGGTAVAQGGGRLRSCPGVGALVRTPWRPAGGGRGRVPWGIRRGGP
mmetsp:Transcript_14429/g.28862  ORF Transcript_14429/g.28862 Transcript_14429/m.28862 type:complete len:214 (+) Transcript_14429:480-1121(+)